MNKPTTKKEWAAYRAQLTCIIGKEEISHAVDNRLCLEKPTITALYHLLNAVHDLSLLAFDPNDITTNQNELLTTPDNFAAGGGTDAESRILPRSLPPVAIHPTNAATHAPEQ